MKPPIPEADHNLADDTRENEEVKCDNKSKSKRNATCKGCRTMGRWLSGVERTPREWQRLLPQKSQSGQKMYREAKIF
jgi:hypothetical protein